jgi:hypothetical protein
MVIDNGDSGLQNQLSLLYLGMCLLASVSVFLCLEIYGHNGTLQHGRWQAFQLFCVPKIAATKGVRRYSPEKSYDIILTMRVYAVRMAFLRRFAHFAASCKSLCYNNAACKKHVMNTNPIINTALFIR